MYIINLVERLNNGSYIVLLIAFAFTILVLVLTIISKNKRNSNKNKKLKERDNLYQTLFKKMPVGIAVIKNFW